MTRRLPLHGVKNEETMDTFEIKRDIVYFEGEAWIILGEKELEKAFKNIDAETTEETREWVYAQFQRIKEDRKRYKDCIRTVVLTVKKPTPADRIEVHSASRDKSGVYDQTREPLVACQHLIKSWTLVDIDGKSLECNSDNIAEKMPICLLDAVYFEIKRYLYPDAARLSFLPLSVAS